MNSRFYTLITRSLLALTISFGLQAWSAAEVMTEGVKPGKWTMDLEAAKTYAEENEIPLFLNFTGSDWCGWCKLMDKNVFADPQWEQFAKDNLVLVTIDFPQDESIVPEKYKERNRELQAEYGVEGYPTYLILTPDMDVVGQLGAGQDKNYQSFRREVMDVLKYTDAQVEAFTAKLEAGVAQEYKKAVMAMRSADEDLREWLASGPEQNEANVKKFMNFQKQMDDARQTLRGIEVNEHAKQLPEKQASAYRETYQELVKAEAELDTWLMSMPEQSEENMEKFQRMQKQLSELRAKLAEFETTQSQG